MKNNFLLGLFIGVVTMSLFAFTAVQTTNVFAPATPTVVSAKFCNTQLEILQAIKYYADRKYTIDINQLNSGAVIVIGKKY